MLIDKLKGEADRMCRLDFEMDDRLDTDTLAASVDDVVSMARHMLEVLVALECWFDTDQEILDEMDADTLADHNRQLSLIRSAISHAKRGYRS